MAASASGAISTTGSISDDGSFYEIGVIGDGTLSIDAGSLLSRRTSYLGYSAGWAGTATVTGTGSTWSNFNDLFIGNSGSGSLTVQNGAQVSDSSGWLGYSSASSGTATVSGATSKWTTSSSLFVGVSGTGAISVQNGSQVSSATCYLGSNPGSTGAVTISGTGSKLTNSGSLYIGNLGSGMLTVADGGLLTAGALFASPADLHGNGTITISGAVLDASLQFDSNHGTAQALGFGAGGTLILNATGILGAGYKGIGSLSIADGLTVASGVGYLGYQAGSVGTATVTGGGSKWTGSSLYVGFSGGGTLNIQSGAQVTRSSDVFIGDGASTTGAVDVAGAGSMLSTTGALYVGYAGSGTLSISNGASITIHSLYASLPDLSGDGTISVSSGAVLDADVAFDSTHGATQALTFGSGGALNVTWNPGSVLGAGYKRTGTLRIADGVSVNSSNGFLGYQSGSAGAATVTGTSSKWAATSLYVGYIGGGTINIQNGGQVTNTNTYLGNFAAATGAATVSGTGSTLTSSSNFYLGNFGSASLNVQNGGQVSDAVAFLAYNSGSSGTATISGTGSRWTNNGDLYVGNSGTGALNIQNGGQVSAYRGLLGQAAGSTGTVTVSGAGSIWSPSSGLQVGTGGIGTLTILNGGQVNSNISGNDTTLGYFQGSVGMVIVSGDGSTWTNHGGLTIGIGTLNIQAGGQVICDRGASVNNGTASVSGAGSTWVTNGSGLFVGEAGGKGILKIQNGGQVSSSYSYLGYGSNATGTATVTGSGSIWSQNGSLFLGSNASGALTVADAGKVTASELVVGSTNSRVNLNVSGSSMFVLGNASTVGDVVNAGAINLYANFGLAAGVYTPIADYAGRAMTWSGNGSYNAIGGAWDNPSHTFIVPVATALASGAISNLSSGQRLLITDAPTNTSVGASFGPITGSPILSAVPMTSPELSALAALPGFNDQVLEGWDFTTTLPSGSEVLLSFNLAPGYDPSTLHLWHLSNNTWTNYTPSWQTYSTAGTLDFPVTSFSGYAVTVPEPASLAYVALIPLALLRPRRRRRRCSSSA